MIKVNAERMGGYNSSNKWFYNTFTFLWAKKVQRPQASFEYFANKVVHYNSKHRTKILSIDNR